MDIYAAALPGCPRLGAKHMRALMDYFETAEDVWKASAESIEKSHILTGKTLAAFLAYRNETSLEQIEEKLYRLDIRCFTFEDSDYPPLLATTANPPAVLFYRGALPCFERTIAIVGSRKATAYGIETAHELARGLSAHGITVVSGGARGIDSASHTGAMEGGSPTVVVLACGLDRVYPPENRHLFHQVIESGGTLVSEYPPGTPPLGRQFPARNRIIAGMSRGYSSWRRLNGAARSLRLTLLWRKGAMYSLSRGASGCLPARGRISSSETVPSAVHRQMTSSRSMDGRKKRIKNLKKVSLSS